MLATQLFSDDLVTWAPSFKRGLPTSTTPDGAARSEWLGQLNLMTCSGTSALYHVARALGLKAGDAVLVPAYHCGKESAPFVHLGVRPTYYRINADLTPDIEHIEGLIKPKTKAILVTHYFGLPQSLELLRVICQARGVRLIEDCAHALFGRSSEGCFGSIGDAAVFSPRKFLAIPDGGVAILNDPDLTFSEIPPAMSPSLTAARVLRLWHKSLKLGAPPIRRVLMRVVFGASAPAIWSTSRLANYTAKYTNQWDPDARSVDPPIRELSQGMSVYARRCLERIGEPEYIVRARRQNYQRLLVSAKQSGVLEPLSDSLPSGANPLCFPTRCRAPKWAAHFLQKRGVMAIAWWPKLDPRIPWQDFPTEHDLKKSMLAFPVHQSLSRGAVQRIIDSFAELRGYL